MSIILLGKLGRDEKGGFYDYPTRITLAETNIEGTVSHDQYARLFGKAREMFILENLPKAAVSMGQTHFLQTRSASYDFRKNCRFGELMIIKLRVLRVGNSSFEIGAEFFNEETKDIYAIGKQVIVCTDLKGSPIKIPDTLRTVLMEALPSNSSQQQK
jgi:acyl-CoA thioesterase FadM